MRALVRTPLLILLATCQVDKLTNTPPPLARLTLAPDKLQDSAALGSTRLDGDSIAVANAGQGTLSWGARLAQGESWLAIVSATSGTAPAKLRIAFNPAGLPSGVYRDTVVVSAENAMDSPGRVPVEFTVHPCMPVAIALDAQIADSLTNRDCTAPHRPTGFARVYGFSANAGDSVSVVMTSGPVDAYVVLDSSLADGAPVLAQNDRCTTGADACLRYQRLPRSGAYWIEATSAGAGQTGSFALSVSRPRAPAPPAAASLAQLRIDSITAIATGGGTDQDQVVLRGAVTDPDAGDSLRLEVEVRPIGTPFTGTPTQAGARVASGQPAFVAVPGLANNTAYHWQARAADQTGRSSGWTAFGANAETAADFVTTIPQPPAVPTDTAQFQSDGTTAIAVGGTAPGRSVIFKASVTDPNPGDQLRLEVEVKPVGTAFDGVVTGTGPAVATGSTATATVAGLSDNTAYHWRARAVDQTSRASSWVPFGNNAESATDFRVAVAATQLAFTTQPSSAVAGAAISPAVKVTAQDALGNALTSFSGTVTVSLASNPGGDTLSGTKTVAALNGVATFADLSVAHAAAGYTLQAAATVTGTTLTVTSGPFTISAAAAKRLVFTGQPSTTPAGAAITPAIQATARDSFGNTATGFAANVTLAIGNNPGGGTLSGTATQAAVAGVASFSGLTIDKAGSGYTLTAAATGLASGTSAPFTITAAAAGKLALAVTPPAAAQSGVAFSRQPAVQVQDANGNPVSTQGVVVTAAIATGPPGGTLASAVATSDANGLATFAGLAISGSTGNYTLTFTASGLAPVTSGTIALAAGPAAKLALVTQPSDTARSGTVLARQPVVQLQDAAGNPVNQSGTSVTAAVASGGPSLTGTNPVATDASGRATFVNLTLTGLVGPRTLSFSAGAGLASVISNTVTLVAGAATQIAVNAGNNQTVTAGTAVPIPPSVIVKDASGNPVSGVAVTFAVATGGGSVTGASQTTDAGGIATVGGWTLGTTAGSNTLTATSGTLAGNPVTFTATGTAGNAGSIAVSAGNNQSATVNTAVTAPPAVIVKDANGNPVQGVSVTFAVGIGNGSITGASQTTNVNGVAAVGSWTLGTSAGTNTLTATAPGVNGSPVTFTATGTAGAPSGSRSVVAAAPDTISASNGASAATITVTVNDEFGNPVAGATVTLAATGSGNALTQPSGTTGANGQITGALSSTKAETKTVSAMVNGTTPVGATATVIVAPAAPAAIAANAGNGQSATVGTAVAVPPSVIVRDAFGNPAAGVAVTFAPASGGGSVTGGSQTTGANGIATVTSWTLGNTAGANTLTATSGSLQGSPVTFTATATAGAAAQIAVHAGDGQSARVGTTVAVPPSVIVTDQHGNPVAGVAVTFAPGSGGGSVTPTSPVTTGADGIAAVTSWTLGTTAGPNTLTATSGTLAGSPVTFTATATAGNATRLAIATQPSATVQSGIPFPQQPVIQLQDGSGNPVSQAGVTVGVKIQSGGGTLGGTTSATTGANGQAVFTDLSIAGSVGPRTLRFGSAGLDSVTSATVNVAAGTATQIAVNGGDGQQATTGTAVATPPSVIVRDASNNPVQGVGVTFAVASGGGSVTGADQTTNASGIATVGSWTLGTTAGTNTLTASAAGLTGSPVTFTATGTAGQPTTLAKFSGDNQVGQVGTTLATPQTVLVTDAHGNPVPSVTVTWAASGGGSVNPTSSATDLAGHASTTRTLGPTPGTETTTASVTGLTPVTFTVTAQVGGATQMAISGGQSQTDTVGQTLPTPLSVRVADALNNPVSGVTISWSVLDGGGSVNPASSVTNTNGIASTNWTLGTAMSPTDSTQTAQATGVGSALSFTAFTVPDAVSATQTSVVAAPASITASTGSSPSTITVTARDQYGNVIKSKSVVLAATGSGNTLVQPSGPTGTNGAATGTLSSTVAQQKTVSATVGGVPVNQQATITVSPAAAAQLAFIVQPSTVAAGSAITPAMQVEVRDQFGNRVTTATPGVALGFGIDASGGTAHLGGTLTETAAGGVATFGDISVDRAANGYTLVASAGSLSAATSNAFNVTSAVATSIGPNGGNNQTATVGTAVAIPPSVIVRDQFNNPVAGVPVTFAPAAGSGSVSPTTPVLTNASGIAALTSWTLGNTAGPNTLSATSSGLTGSPVAFSATGTAGAATQMALNAGNDQTAIVGTAVAVPPSVIVRDQFGNPVAGVAVTFSTSGDNGTVDPVTAVTTSASGVAAANSWTLGTTAKTDTLRATSSGLTGSPVTFTATATPGAPSASQSTVTAAPETITAGLGTSTITVTVRDAGGNPVSGASVTLAATPTTGNTLTQPSGTTNANGQISGTLSSTAAGSKTVTATVNGTMTVTQMATVTVSPAGASASQSLVAASPGTITASAGSSASTITVTVMDANDNPVSGATVTLAASPSTGITVTQPAGTTNTSGQITGTLSSTTAGTKTVTATVNGTVTVTQTATVTVNAATAATIAPSAGNGQTAPAGTAVPVPPSVLVTDAFGNPVSGVSVSFAPGPASGSVTGAAQTTGASGIAAVGSWTLSTTAGSNTLTATSGTLSGSPVTFTATGTAGPATQMAVNGGNNQTATVGSAVPVAPSVMVRDQFNNPVAGVAVTFTPAAGSGTVSPTTPVSSDASGVATVTSWTLGATAGTDTLRATATGLSGSPAVFTATATAGGPSAAQSSVAAAPGTITAGSGASTITVTVRDAGGNAVSGATVTLAATPTAGNTLTQPAGATDLNGQVTGTLSSTAAGTKTVSATVNGTIVVVQTATVVVNPGPVSAAQSTLSATSPVAAGSGTSTITVTARDANGNPIQGATVTLAATPTTGNTLTQPTGTTDASGVATGTLASTAAETKTVSATINGVAITQTATVVVTAGAVSAAQSSVTALSPITAGSGTSTVTVTARDANGNPIQGATVTLAATPTAGNTLTQPVGTTDANGVATGTLSSTAAGSKTVSATINAVAITQTATVVVNAGAVSASQSTVAATSPIAAGTGTSTISVTAKDGFGNPIAGATVVLAATGTANTLTQPGGPTNGDGVATGTLSSPVAESKTVSATINGVAATQTATVVVTASAVSGAQSSVAATSPITASSGASTSTITVTARDALGNPVAGATVLLAATGTGNTLTQPSATTNASGVATGTLSSTVAESKTVSATINGVAVSQTATVVVSAAPVSAAQSTVTATSPITAESGTSTVTVTAKDGFGNPIAGATVTLAATPTTGNTLTQPVGTTDASGVATGTLSSTAAGSKTVSATINAVAITQTATVVVTAGTVSAAQSTVTATSPITAGSGTSTITVTAKDGFGNPIAGATVTLAATPTTGNTLTQPVGTTDASGIATGTLSSTAAGSKTVSATINAVAITQTATVVVNAGAVSAAQSTVSATSPIAAGNGTSTITVTAKDVNGNPIQGATVTLAATGSGNSLTQPAGPTDATGVATGALSSTTAESKTVSATINGVAITQTATVVVTAGSVSGVQSSVSATSPITAGSGTSTITVTARDASGNVVQGATVVLAATGSGNTLTQPAATNASGVTTGTLSSTVAESKTVSATINGVAVTQTAIVVVDAGAASKLALTTPPSSTAQSGVALAQQPVVQVQDANGNAVSQSGVTVTATVTPAGATLSGATATTGATGAAAFSGLTLTGTAGSYTLSFGSANLTSATAPITLGAGVPATITSNSPTTQSGTVGTAVASPPSVLVRDGAGNPVAGVAVTFAVTPGNGSVTGGSQTTNGSGVATVGSWTLGTTVGTDTLTATASGSGITGNPVTFRADASAGAPTQIVFTVPPSNTPAGAIIKPPVQVSALDQFGNTATQFTGNVAMAITANSPGNDTLSGTKVVAAVTGVATFSNLWINTAGTGYRLRATGGQMAVNSPPFNITTVTPTQLVFTVPPSNTTAGTTITPAVKVTAQDAAGNTATSFTGNVTLAIGTNPGGGTLTGGGAVAAVNGVATFSGLSIDKAGTGYTLTAASGTLSGASPAFNITGSSTVSASQSTVVATSPITAGGAPSTITVTAKDAFGNPIAGATVTLAATPAAGNTLTQPAATTDANGVATGTLSSTSTGSKTVSATINGVAITQTATVVVTAGAVSAAQSTVAATSPITASSGASQSTITVTARDGFGNPISGATVVLAATGTGNTLTQPVATTDASGVATGTLSSTVAEAKTVSATINAVGVTQTATVVVNAAAVSGAQSTVAATSPIAAGSGSSTITVTARDGFGNPIAGATVVLAATGTGNTLTQPSNPTNAAGVATGTLSSVVAESKTVSATINAVAVAQTATVVVEASTVSGAQSTVAATSPITASTGASTSTITVTAKDALGNPVAGATVVLAATGSGNSLTQPGATTNSSGVATGTLSSTVAESKTVSATVNGVAVTATATVVVNPGAAAKVVLTTQPSSTAQSGVALAQQPAVQLEDANNNPVAESGVLVTATAAPAGATPSNATATTGSTGSAAFSGLTLTGNAGSYTLSFGGTGLTAATSGTITLTAAGTTTTITGDTPDPSVVGEAVAVTFTVTATGGTPPGSVTVSDGTASCIGTVSAGSCNLTPTTAGAKTLVATYAGDADFTGSVSPGVAHTVTAASTTTAITSDTPDPSAVGQAVPFAFTVAANAPGSGTPTGTVTVSDGTQSCSASVAVGSCSIAFSTAGTKSVTASYAGDGNFAASTSAAEPHTVGAATTATTITGHTPDPSTVGQGVAVTFTVSSSGGTPTGNVTVSDGTAQCTGTVAAGSCTLTPTTAGAKTLVATYAGDADFAASTSAGVSQTVNPASTATTITSDSPDPSTAGQAITVAFTVTSTGGTPTGNVTVSDGTLSCSATVAAGQCSLTPVTVGTETLTATYAGDGNFSGSVSAGEPHSVTAGLPSGTHSSMSASPSPITASSGSSASTITVTVRDAFNNAVQGATVVLSSDGTGNTLTQPVGTTDVNGQVTGTLSSTVAEVKNVSATVNGSVPLTQTVTVTVSPAAATLLAFTTQPSTVVLLNTIGPVVVTAFDQFGNVATGFTNDVTMAIAKDGSILTNATLGGTTVVAAVAGVATFSDLTIDQLGTGYELGASASGLTGATSDPFDVVTVLP